MERGKVVEGRGKRVEVMRDVVRDEEEVMEGGLWGCCFWGRVGKGGRMRGIGDQG